MIKKIKNKYNIISKYLSNMFFFFGIFLFNAKKKEYGGFNHFLSEKIFKNKYTYMEICLTYNFGFEKIHNDDNYYYDGYHNHILFGFFRIAYGT